MVALSGGGGASQTLRGVQLPPAPKVYTFDCYTEKGRRNYCYVFHIARHIVYVL